MAVVTGPNMGGKTAALRTLGFCAACAVLGVPVPARSAALPLFDEIAWLGLASDAAGVDAGFLSSFGREIVALDALLERPLENALPPHRRVRADHVAERGSRALDRAAREPARARRHRARGHALRRRRGGGRRSALRDGPLANVPVDAAERTSPAAALGRVAAGMDFSLERVDATDEPVSDALALAAALGLEPRIVARARAVLRDDG